MAYIVTDFSIRDRSHSNPDSLTLYPSIKDKKYKFYKIYFLITGGFDFFFIENLNIESTFRVI